MKRLAGALLAVAVAMLTPASSAWARGDGWQPNLIDPFDLFVCGANMHFEFPVNNEYFRIVTIGGQETLQITGHLTVTVTNLDTGQTLTDDNISGPGFIPLTETGFEFSGRGINQLFLTPDQSAATGLPELFDNAGYIDIVFNDDGSVTVKKLTGDLTDLCAILT
jgi:hypothetical protein